MPNKEKEKRPHTNAHFTYLLGKSFVSTTMSWVSEECLYGMKMYNSIIKFHRNGIGFTCILLSSSSTIISAYNVVKMYITYANKARKREVFLIIIWIVSEESFVKEKWNKLSKCFGLKSKAICMCLLLIVHTNKTVKFALYDVWNNVVRVSFCHHEFDGQTEKQCDIPKVADFNNALCLRRCWRGRWQKRILSFCLDIIILFC